MLRIGKGFIFEGDQTIPLTFKADGSFIGGIGPGGGPQLSLAGALLSPQ